jgi:hypothetical protein
MSARARFPFIVAVLMLLAACGAAPSTAPLACAPIRANFVRTDSVFYPCDTLRDGTVGPKVLAFLVDIYACNGADVGQRPAR